MLIWPLLLGWVCLGHLPVWGTGIETYTGAAPLWQGIQSMWEGPSNATALPGYLNTAGWIAIVFLQALFLCLILNAHNFFEQSHYFAGWVYVLLLSLLEENLFLSGVLIAQCFNLVALEKLLRMYEEQKTGGLLFDACFWISVGALFYQPNFVLLPLVFVGLLFFHTLHLRHVVMGGMGVLTPFVLTGTYFFWYDRLPEMISSYIPEELWSAGLPIAGMGYTTTAFAVLGLLTVAGLIQIRRYYLTRVVRYRKHQMLIVWWLLISGLGMFLVSHDSLRYFVMITIPMSVLLTYLLVRIKSRWLADICLLILVALPFYRYYGEPAGLSDWLASFF